MNTDSPSVEAYLAAWNEPDPARRRRLVEAIFADGATYVDPRLEATGHAQLDAMLDAVQGMLPGHRFAPLGEAERHHDRMRFRWALHAPGGGVVAEGTDVAMCTGDGRFAEVVGFLDRTP